MKAAKYIINTDHNANHNHEDAYIRLNATKLIDAMTETAKVIENDDNLYCTTIYQLVAGTNGKEYRPVARNYGHGGFYVAGTGSWSTDHSLIREASKDIECFAFQFDWAK